MWHSAPHLALGGVTLALGEARMTDAFAAEWKELHGFDLTEATRAATRGTPGELAAYRPAGFLGARNVFEAAVLASQGSHALLLWEAFASVLPVQSLGNGDIMCLHVPRVATAERPVGAVVWNHERDAFERPASEDLRQAPVARPFATETPPLGIWFAARARYIAQLLAGKPFDVYDYAATERFAVEVTPALLENVERATPTGTYTLWHCYFTGNDAALARVLEAAKKSPARWTRDAAALLEAVTAGRDEIGALRGMAQLRKEVAAVIADPMTAEKAVAARKRADVDRRIVDARGPVRLVRDDAPASPASPLDEASFGDLALALEKGKYTQHYLVLREGGVPRDAVQLAGGAEVELEPAFFVVQREPIPLVAVTRKPNVRPGVDGELTLYAVKERCLARAATWEFDVDHLETRDGAIVARAADGVGYRVAVEDLSNVSRDPTKAVPATEAAPPEASPDARLDGDDLELTATSLKLLRNGKVLFEEPLDRAYAMTVLPARRMVAVHRTDHDHRPLVDVLYVRELKRAVKPGNGCCSWICFHVPGWAVELRSTRDALFVFDGARWMKIDDQALTTVPSWIENRGWL